ncbi:hypothetical protein COCVIDRAFT_111327, partial [Bipolaris victoriae FI3]
PYSLPPSPDLLRARPSTPVAFAFAAAHGRFLTHSLLQHHHHPRHPQRANQGETSPPLQTPHPFSLSFHLCEL